MKRFFKASFASSAYTYSNIQSSFLSKSTSKNSSSIRRASLTGKALHNVSKKKEERSYKEVTNISSANREEISASQGVNVSLPAGFFPPLSSRTTIKEEVERHELLSASDLYAIPTVAACFRTLNDHNIIKDSLRALRNRTKDALFTLLLHHLQMSFNNAPLIFSILYELSVPVRCSLLSECLLQMLVYSHALVDNSCYFSVSELESNSLALEGSALEPNDDPKLLLPHHIFLSVYQPMFRRVLAELSKDANSSLPLLLYNIDIVNCSIPYTEMILIPASYEVFLRRVYPGIRQDAPRDLHTVLSSAGWTGFLDFNEVPSRVIIEKDMAIAYFRYIAKLTHLYALIDKPSADIDSISEIGAVAGDSPITFSLLNDINGLCDNNLASKDAPVMVVQRRKESTVLASANELMRQITEKPRYVSKKEFFAIEQEELLRRQTERGFGSQLLFNISSSSGTCIDNPTITLYSSKVASKKELSTQRSKVRPVSNPSPYPRLAYGQRYGDGNTTDAAALGGDLPKPLYPENTDPDDPLYALYMTCILPQAHQVQMRGLNTAIAFLRTERALLQHIDTLSSLSSSDIIAVGALLSTPGFLRELMADCPAKRSPDGGLTPLPAWCFPFYAGYLVDGDDLLGIADVHIRTAVRAVMHYDKSEDERQTLRFACGALKERMHQAYPWLRGQHGHMLVCTFRYFRMHEQLHRALKKSIVAENEADIQRSRIKDIVQKLRNTITELEYAINANLMSIETSQVMPGRAVSKVDPEPLKLAKALKLYEYWFTDWLANKA